MNNNDERKGKNSVQGAQLHITDEEPNSETIAAMKEYYAMKEHPENYKRYSSFGELLDEEKS